MAKLKKKKEAREEELAAVNHLCIFYPKFHREILVWSKMVFAGELQLFFRGIKGHCSQGFGLCFYRLNSPLLQTL